MTKIETKQAGIELHVFDDGFMIKPHMETRLVKRNRYPKLIKALIWLAMAFAYCTIGALMFPKQSTLQSIFIGLSGWFVVEFFYRKIYPNKP